jgi:hypothetical protein
MYIDPNTGGILFQALAVILVAGSGVLLFFSRNIREGIVSIPLTLLYLKIWRGKIS